MTERKIAERYARALLNLAQDQGTEAAVHDDVLGIAQAIRQSAELQAFLRHPTLSREQQDRCVVAIFSSRLNTLTYSFVRFLAQRRRLARLPQVCEAFVTLYREARDILPVVACSAQPLSEEQAEQIRSRMASRYGKSIALTRHVDPNLVGGFTIQVRDTILDYSVKGKLDSLRRALCHA